MLVLRGFFLVAGSLLLAIGFIGIFLPVLPTTPFVILAAACFARASPKLDDWLVNHRHFGPGLRQWRERGAISRRAKALAVAGVTIGFFVFSIRVEPEPWLALLTAGLMLSVLAYVLSRPS